MAPRKSTKSTATPKPEPEENPSRPAKAASRKTAKPAVSPEPVETREVLATKASSKRPSKKKDALPEAKPAPVEQLPAIETIPETPGLSPHALTVLTAIQAGRAVEFIFQDAESNPPRTFEPRQLIFDVFTKAWFAWGWDRRYNAERHHRLDQMAEINLVDGVGRAAQGPFKEGTPANQIGGWLGGEPIPVKVVLLKQWVFAVKQAPAPFPEFKIEDIEEGKAQVTFTGTDLRAITRWCLQFGDGIQIQEPQRLADRLKQLGIAWAGKAAPAPPPPPPQPKPVRSEPRQERPEPVRKPDPPRREFKEQVEEAPKSKPAKVEIRIERL